MPDTINQLRKKIGQTLDQILPTGAKCVLLDFPNYSNVGDSAIWLGEIEYLKARNVTISYVADCINDNLSVLKQAISEKDYILINGGGNFGDLWPHHQTYREKIIQAFPENPIIQLPQSIHFQDKANLDRVRKIINSHENFTLLARDEASYELAHRVFEGQVLLCPDMAFMLDLYHIGRAIKPYYDVSFLRRTDKESAGRMFDLPGTISAFVYDWLDEVPPPKTAAIYAQLINRLSSTPVQSSHLSELIVTASLRLALERVIRGAFLLKKGRVVVTDRLHGLIMATLLGLPVLARDNSYGKLSQFCETWLKPLIDAGIISFPDSQQAFEHNLAKMIRRDVLIQISEYYENAEAATTSCLFPTVWDRLTGQPGSLGSEFLRWAYLYQHGGNKCMARQLAIKAITYAPLCGRGYKLLIDLFISKILTPRRRSIIAWYKKRLGEVIFGKQAV
ncbi:hypothetical protein JCM13664_02930 [Methylothermus subterraneus]